MGLINDIQVLAGKKKETPSPPDEKSQSSKKILIVEDEKALGNILKDRFIREGYHVFTAENGQEGLEMATVHHPDVVLLDLLMPVMNGKSMLIKLRDVPEFKKLPVIILTNAGEVENIRITRHYFDAAEFLIKSNVTLDEIVAKVKAFTW